VQSESARETEVLGRKSALVPLRPPQISHDLNRARTRAAAVGIRRLTAWAMALATSYLVKCNPFIQSYPY
jgi:hypothetical protein